MKKSIITTLGLIVAGAVYLGVAPREVAKNDTKSEEQKPFVFDMATSEAVPGCGHRIAVLPWVWEHEVGFGVGITHPNGGTETIAEGDTSEHTVGVGDHILVVDPYNCLGGIKNVLSYVFIKCDVRQTPLLISQPANAVATTWEVVGYCQCPNGSGGLSRISPTLYCEQ